MDYATQNHLQPLRNLLVHRLAALQVDIDAAGVAQRAAPPPTEVSDRKDQAAVEQRTGVDDAQLRRDLDEAEAVRSALARLDQGRYGDCIDCGFAIPLTRLLVQPAALRCSACQAAAEHRRSRGAS